MRSASACRSATRAHPRSRGENAGGTRNERLPAGSSPLTRGRSSAAFGVGRSAGLIPAHAGKMGLRERRELLRRAHPRSRGENSEACATPATSDWLIPAHAGKITGRPASPSAPWAHPRSRGENAWMLVGGRGISGSSPLTRGKSARASLDTWVTGLIPAHAGKISRALRAGRRRRAHPRSRGENLKSECDAHLPAGSSPLTLGKSVSPRRACQEGGLIPAHAGKI